MTQEHSKCSNIIIIGISDSYSVKYCSTVIIHINSCIKLFQQIQLSGLSHARYNYSHRTPLQLTKMSHIWIDI